MKWKFGFVRLMCKAKMPHTRRLLGTLRNPVLLSLLPPGFQGILLSHKNVVKMNRI